MWVEMIVAVRLLLLSLLSLFVSLDVHSPDVLCEEIFPWVLVLSTGIVFGAELTKIVAELHMLGVDMSFPFILGIELRLAAIW